MKISSIDKETKEIDKIFRTYDQCKLKFIKLLSIIELLDRVNKNLHFKDDV